MPTCEDLATKAELQELRDQLNVILGEKEDGGSVNPFVKGQSPILTAGAMLGTVFLATKDRAANAVMDIVLDNPTNNPIWRDLANGNAKWAKVKGSGVRTPLPDLGKLSKAAGSGATISSVGARTTAAAGQGIGILANLAAIGTTLALSKATVDIFDKRIEAEAKGSQMQIDAVNSSMLRLYEKNQGNISAANQEIDQLQSTIQDQSGAISSLQFDASQTQAEVQNLSSDLDLAATRITILESVSAESRQQIQELEGVVAENDAEARAAIEALTLTVTELDNVLELAKDTLAKQEVIILKLDERVTYLEQITEELAFAYGRQDAELALLRFEFDLLQGDIDADNELQDARAKSTEAKLIILQHRANRAGGGTSGAVKQSLVDQQNGVLDLANKLSGNQAEIDPVDETDIDNAADGDASKFKGQLDALLKNIPTEGMTPQQIEDLRDGIKTDFDSGLNLAIGTLLVPNLVDLKDATSERKLADATKLGICESLNSPNTCGASAGNPNPTQGLGGMQQAAKAQFDAVLRAMGAADLVQGQTILGIVKNTNGVVNNAQHGLAKIQTFASTAWKATRADKILAGVSMALTVHNAMMLSNNLLLTMSEATNMALDALGIRDETDAPINFGALVKDKIAAVLTSILGAEQYALLTARIAKANRIYQASVNVLDTTQSLFDSARSVAELTAENTGKIGNALRESGAVYEDAYEEFAERINPQNRAQRNLEKFRGSIEGVSEVFETIEGISSNVVEFQETANQLKEEKEEWKTELDTEIEVKVTEKTEAKEGLQVDADITKADFGKVEEEEES